MINKIIKLLSNPQGVLIQALLEQFSKIFKSQKVLEYVEMENELDVAVKEIKKDLESVKFKTNAIRDLIKDFQNQIDDIKKIAHPSAIEKKEIDEIKADMKKIRNMKVFKKLG
tara:strand:- start:131 stop:469 length:339 start_codon:yes stop_codon:yes gene_type:complete